MGFRKEIYDVEKKGLNPNKPHSNLNADGTLVPKHKNSDQPVVNSISNVSIDIVEDVNKKTTNEQEKEIKTSVLEKPTNKNEFPNALKELPKNKTTNSTKKKTTKKSSKSTKKTQKKKTVKKSSKKSTKKEDS